MNLEFKGNYKCITPFNWINIPRFSVITGPNGTGKSQLLELIFDSITNNPNNRQRVIIEGETFNPGEVSFQKGEWSLEDSGVINLQHIQSQIINQYRNFLSGRPSGNNVSNVRWAMLFEDILERSGKRIRSEVSEAEFIKLFPSNVIDKDSSMSRIMAEIFYNYRLSEIELLAKHKSENEIIKEIGHKPWVILAEILTESKLPFNFSDPSRLGVRESFEFKIFDDSKTEIKFRDLSSGERVLFSLVLYLYNSRENNFQTRLLLMDEPDAHLHPSMSSQFIDVIKNVLVDQFGVRVIMTTHSPSTLVLAPEDSIFEMSRRPPRIKSASSKNHAISQLTSGLVYVGENTKYVLVEDIDDVTFYSYVFDLLKRLEEISRDIPLVFIPASTKNKSGGASVVENWVEKLQKSGLEQLISGIIDNDGKTHSSEGVQSIDRYCIENYLVDPVLVYAAFMDKDKHNDMVQLGLSLGDEYKLKNLSQEKLQMISDVILSKCQPKIEAQFEDFDSSTETERFKIEYTNGISLEFPKWLLHRSGKKLLNEAFNNTFGSSIINRSTLMKAFKKTKLVPVDFIRLFEEIQFRNISGHRI